MCFPLTTQNALGWVYTIEEVKPASRKGKKKKATYLAGPKALGLEFYFDDKVDLIPVS